jgi:hypothetical protein
MQVLAGEADKSAAELDVSGDPETEILLDGSTADRYCSCFVRLAQGDNPMMQRAFLIANESLAAVPNRGRLRNGNPSGDYMKAPRCGAKTRAGGCSCRQPAMRNGRCRFHGGKSTGARTATGRARCARARRTHGFYSAETVALRRAARTLLRRNRDLLAALRARPAGHGVLRSKSSFSVGARCARPPSSGAASTPGTAHPADPQARAARPYMSGSTDGVSAGHGVLRSILRFAAGWLGLQPGSRA